MKTITQIPKVYLSTSDSGETYTVINNGMPLCRHTTKELAMQTAKNYSLSITQVWDGLTGTFTEL